MALHHASSGEVVHLDDLRGSANSTALVKTDQFEAIHLIVPAGSTIATHRVAGQATIQCLRGRVTIPLRGKKAAELSAGDWLYLERGEEHAVDGLEDSALLLTILFT